MSKMKKSEFCILVPMAKGYKSLLGSLHIFELMTQPTLFHECLWLMVKSGTHTEKKRSTGSDGIHSRDEN